MPQVSGAGSICVKFCYVDESGMGNERIATMVGVVTDATRMRMMKAEWAGLLIALRNMTGRNIVELHANEIYRGNGVWRGVRPALRSAVFKVILDWLEERRHKVIVVAIDKDRFDQEFEAQPFAVGLGTVWRCLGLHLALAAQKLGQREANNKGHTVLIFDNRAADQHHFTELIAAPPAWTETFYERAEDQDPLDQLVDVPHFVESHRVGLIQLADCLSFIMRKHLELVEGKRQPDFEGEANRLAAWAAAVMERSVNRANTFPRRGRCAAAEFFCRFAPPSLL
jgi:hypothetical protein